MPVRPSRIVATSVLVGLVLTALAGAPAFSAPPQAAPRFGMANLDWAAPQPSVDRPATEVVRDGMARLDGTDELQVLSVRDVDGRPEVEVVPVRDRAAAVREVREAQADPDLVAVELDRPRQVHLEGEPAGPQPSGPAAASGQSDASVASNDPLRSLQWGLDAIGAEQAWPITRGQSVVVAVLDTGVDGAHPDFGGRVLPGAAFPADGRAGNVSVAPHGTHVAGIIAAQADNGIGIAGVAPQATILPVRIFNSAGWGMNSDIVSGMLYATDNGASVINMSYSAVDPTDSERAAVAYARDRGVVLVAATGNGGRSMPAGTPTYPAAYPGVIAVSNLQQSPLRTNPTSNNGTFVDLGAPGTQIPSTNPDNQYASMTGTSMAAPQVSGVAALLKARYTGLTPEQIDGTLISTTKDVDSAGYDPLSGYGLVQAPASLTAAQCVAAGTCATPVPTLAANLTQAYVEKAYLAVLGRPATPNDLWVWGRALAGGTSPAAFANALVSSDEYRARFVTQTYEHYLGRTPTGSDVNFWLGSMRAGASQTAVTAAILASPEHFQRAGGTDAAWVRTLYQDVLGRDASQGDVDGWVAVLRGGVSRTAVAGTFLTSDEYLHAQVRASYGSLLGRTPTADELRVAVSAMRSTGGIEPVLVTILSSSGFRSLSVQAFGPSGFGLTGHAP